PNAAQYLNANAPSSTATPNAASGSGTWTVSAQTTTPLVFAPILGIQNGAVGATAVAIHSGLQSIDASYLLPYVVWAGNSGGINSPGGLNNGDRVELSNDDWIDHTILPKPHDCAKSKDDGKSKNQDCNPNPNWNVDPDSEFDGFLGSLSGSLGVGQSVSSGGGNEPRARACQLRQAGKPGIFLVMGKAAGDTGPITFTITDFVAIDLDSNACGGGDDLSGRVHRPYNVAAGQPGGNSTRVYVLKLWK
ncbi:MAG: hypothetical protein ACHQ7M_16120, partial [Chloroflexota bacterium]